MKKILVFNEPEIVSFIESSLGDRCEIVWTSKDEEVAALVKQEKPDIVLMNYEASDCSRFAKVIGGIRAENAKVPILLMTGRDVMTHMPVEAKGSIFKPFEKDNLEDMLKRFKIL